MNKSLQEGIQLAEEIVGSNELDQDVQVVLGTPFIHLDKVSQLSTSNQTVGVAAQNCSDKESGAYTGEISVGMVKSTGASVENISEKRMSFWRPSWTKYLNMD